MAAGSPAGKLLLSMVSDNWDEWLAQYKLFFRKPKYSPEHVFLTAVWSIGMYDNWYPWHEWRAGFGMCLEIWVLNQWLVELCVRAGSKNFLVTRSEHPKNF
jgi:hypothetical protein